MSRVETTALLLRRVPYGESDSIVTFFTEKAGTVTALARGSQRSTRRFGGGLEPVHELRVTFDGLGRDLATLHEAAIVRERPRIVSDLERLEAAGKMLRWLRSLCPPQAVDAGVWGVCRAGLDDLDAEAAAPATLLVSIGFALLAEVGYAVEWARCVRCDRQCPEGRAALFDPARGGLVCLRCGGGPRALSPSVRSFAIALQRSPSLPGSPEMTRELLSLVEDVIAFQTGRETSR